MGSDVEKLYPFSEMQNQFKKFGKFGLVNASLLLPMLTAEEGNIPDLDELAENMSDGKEMKEDVFISEKSRGSFIERLKGVITDMVRLGYI